MVPRAASAPSSMSTAMPTFRRRARPYPRMRGYGACIIATTIRAMPVAMIASAQGGVLPQLVHDSSIT